MGKCTKTEISEDMKERLIQNTILPRLRQGLSILLWSCLLGLFLQVTPALATGVYDLPSLGVGSSPWIVDQAEAISLSTEGKINGQLKQLSEKTGNEVRLVVIRRLDYGETIDSFADQLFTQWYSTPEEQANQTLLIIDTFTNNIAIRTGEAVNTIMPEAVAESVAFETARIPVSKAKYNQAVGDISDRLVAILSGQPDPGPPQAETLNIESTFTTAEETDDQNATVWVIVLLTLATIIPMVTYFWYVGFPGRN
jgi:uncharacterized protein